MILVHKNKIKNKKKEYIIGSVYITNKLKTRLNIKNRVNDKTTTWQDRNKFINSHEPTVSYHFLDREEPLKCAGNVLKSQDLNSIIFLLNKQKAPAEKNNDNQYLWLPTEV